MPASSMERALRENKRLRQAVDEREARIVCLETQARSNVRGTAPGAPLSADRHLRPASTKGADAVQQRVCSDSNASVPQPRRATMLDEAVCRAAALRTAQDIISQVPMMGSKKTGRQRDRAPRRDKARSVSNTPAPEERPKLEQPSRELCKASTTLVQMPLRSLSSASTAPLQRQAIYSPSPAPAKKKKRRHKVTCESL